jgi:hypothetical protein
VGELPGKQRQGMPAGRLRAIMGFGGGEAWRDAGHTLAAVRAARMALSLALLAVDMSLALQQRSAGVLPACSTQ